MGAMTDHRITGDAIDAENRANGTRSAYRNVPLLASAMILLEDADVPGAVELRGTMSFWGQVVDEVAVIDWDSLLAESRPPGSRMIASVARSLLEGTPVDLRQIGALSGTEWSRFMRALALAWPSCGPE